MPTQLMIASWRPEKMRAKSTKSVEACRAARAPRDRVLATTTFPVFRVALKDDERCKDCFSAKTKPGRETRVLADHPCHISSTWVHSRSWKMWITFQHALDQPCVFRRAHQETYVPCPIDERKCECQSPGFQLGNEICDYAPYCFL